MAISRSSFTTTWSNSASAIDNSHRAISRRRSICSAVVSPRDSEPSGEFVERWRSNEDHEGCGVRGTDLSGTLDFDLEENVLSSIQHRENRIQKGSIQVGSVLGPLQELRIVDHTAKLQDVHEVVVHAIHLTRSGCPGRHRHRESEGPSFEEPADDGGLAGPRRAGDHHKPTVFRRIRRGGRHAVCRRDPAAAGCRRSHGPPSFVWP